MLPTVRDYQGEPISENARVVERYWLNEDGTMSGELVLHDPENCKRPPVMQLHWKKRNDSRKTEVVGYCDSGSFIYQMVKDNKIEKYIKHLDHRL